MPTVTIPLVAFAWVVVSFLLGLAAHAGIVMAVQKEHERRIARLEQLEDNRPHHGCGWHHNNFKERG